MFDRGIDHRSWTNGEFKVSAAAWVAAGVGLPDALGVGIRAEVCPAQLHSCTAAQLFLPSGARTVLCLPLEAQWTDTLRLRLLLSVDMPENSVQPSSQE